MPDFGIQVPVVLYPRFTTLYGTLALEGYPIDVSAYEAIHLNTWTTPVGGGGVASLMFRPRLVLTLRDPRNPSVG